MSIKEQFTEKVSEIIDLMRSCGIKITEELVVTVVDKCNAILKLGLDEGSNIAIHEYEDAFIAKLKDIYGKLGNEQSRAVIKALYESIEENKRKLDSKENKQFL